jgi:hypothetical protein
VPNWCFGLCLQVVAECPPIPHGARLGESHMVPLKAEASVAEGPVGIED